MPVAGAFDGPNEVTGAQDAGERPAGVVIDVRGEPEFCPRRHDAGETGQHGVGQKAPLALPSFRPWIGIEQINALKSRFRQGFDDGASVAFVKTHVAQLSLFDQRQGFGDAVPKGLAADMTNLRMRFSQSGQMLSAAKTNFEPKLGSAVREQRSRLDWPRRVEANLGQRGLHQFVVARRQPLASATAK